MGLKEARSGGEGLERSCRGTVGGWIASTRPAGGVELFRAGFAGEARARYVGTAAGATADVLSTWRSVLGDRMWIWEREEAIATGIFGPRVTDRARERIGDVVAAA